MRTTRAVVGALFFGVVILVALGSGAMSIGTYDGREDGAIGVEGSAILGSTVVLTGDGFVADGEIKIEIAANADDDALVEVVTAADASGEVREELPIQPPLEPGTWVMAMQGQTPDGATRVLWEHTFVVSALFCKGEMATLVGTAGDDELIGSPGPDVIAGLAGDDVIRGLQGDDVLCAGAGDADVRGGSGDDEIHGQGGQDQLRGNGGADTITGGGGPDQILGGGGADQLRGGGGADVIGGGRGADEIRGGGGGDVLRGNGGRDRILGNRGADTLNGGGGVDNCIGGGGVDSLTNCE